MKLLTTKDIADLLKVKPITVQRMCASGELPALKLGKSYRIEEADFRNWLNKKKRGASNSPLNSTKDLAQSGGVIYEL
jgi:excisionase family DNA binding protein